MALPRRLVKALKAGKYTPGPEGKRAREVAEERNRRQRDPGYRPPVKFTTSVKQQMIQHKHNVLYGDPNYNPVGSRKAVIDSSETEIMARHLNDDDEQIRALASLTSRAQYAIINHGDAGELEVYLPYDFFFYHLQFQERDKWESTATAQASQEGF